MTKHDRIETPEAAAYGGLCRALSASVSAAERLPEGQRVLGEALCAALDTVAAGAPRYEAFGDMRETAAWWADCATPVEVEIYLSVILRRLNRLNGRGLANAARKRVFMELWSAMPEGDQKAFLAKVQPSQEGEKSRPRVG